MGVSAALISGFELGQEGISLENMRLYARAVGAGLGEVRRRWHLAQLSYHEGKAREARAALAGHGGSKRMRGRPGSQSG
jgi:hypothetical protein